MARGECAVQPARPFDLLFEPLNGALSWIQRDRNDCFLLLQAGPLPLQLQRCCCCCCSWPPLCRLPTLARSAARWHSPSYSAPSRVRATADSMLGQTGGRHWFCLIPDAATAASPMWGLEHRSCRRLALPRGVAPTRRHCRRPLPALPSHPRTQTPARRPRPTPLPTTRAACSSAGSPHTSGRSRWASSTLRAAKWEVRALRCCRAGCRVRWTRWPALPLMVFHRNLLRPQAGTAPTSRRPRHGPAPRVPTLPLASMR